MEEERVKHPSFGTIHFSRISGNSGYLFGSEIQANNYIEMIVQEAENVRRLDDDRVFPKRKVICRVKMSPVQFSELITTLNYSTGVPCTIETIDDCDVEQIKTGVESRKSFVNRKFKERMKEFAEGLKKSSEEAQAIIDKKNLSKQDQRDLSNILQQAIQEISRNIPFFSTCFQESMDKIVVDAKAEIDAGIQSMIVKSGLKNLLNQSSKHLLEIEQNP